MNQVLTFCKTCYLETTVRQSDSWLVGQFFRVNYGVSCFRFAM